MSWLGNALKKVGGGIARVAGNVVHAVASNVPIVKNVYGIVTNVVGKDLKDAGNALGSLIDKPKSLPASDAAISAQVHEELQLETGKTEGFGVYDNDLKTVSYASTPFVMNGDGTGAYVTASNTEASYDSNPLLQPAAVKSGVTNKVIADALESVGINLPALQLAITGEAPRGNTPNMMPLVSLSTDGGTSTKVLPETVSALPQQVNGTGKIYMILGGAAAILGIGYLLAKK